MKENSNRPEVFHVLKGANFDVKVAEIPLILEYTDKISGAALPGCASYGPPVITFYDRNEMKLFNTGDGDIDISYRAVRTGPSSAVYHATAVKCGMQRVCFDITVRMDGDRFSLGWKCCLEQNGLELISIVFPEMLGVTDLVPMGRIALTAHGGRLVDPAACEPGEVEHRYNWVMNSFCGCSVVYSQDITAVVKLQSLDDTLLSRVDACNGGKYAMLGISFRHRYTTRDKPYRWAMGKESLIGVESDTEVYPVADSFSIHPESSIEIFLFAHRADNAETGWVFGARKIHEMLPDKPCGFYKDHFVYKIFIGSPGKPVETTFRQALDIIRSFYAATGGAGQICYLVGFQHEGHDSMYPDVFMVNEAAGGKEQLMELFSEAGKYNAIVSLHDNYDDAYMESPGWDPHDISVDRTGHLLRGGIWNGVQAYWISLPVYAETKSRERIGKTLEMYEIKHTYHLDVLTASVFRLDFRLESPSGKDQDCLARLSVVEQFRKRGIDVSSEACGLPFIGHISYFWHMPRVPVPVHEGDKRIPMIPFLIHGKADYGGSKVWGAGVPDGLLYGAFFSGDIRAATPFKVLTDAYFLLQVPLNRLRDDTAARYSEKGTRKKITYSSGNYVEVDFESEGFTVVIDGSVWVKDGTAFFPEDNTDSYIAYVAWKEGFIPNLWTVPKKWDNKKLVATPVNKETGWGDIELMPENGQIMLNLPVGTAYRITLKD